VLRSPVPVALAALVLALLGQCAPVPASRPTAVVAADRSAHLLDRPYPSDELVYDGFVWLDGYPQVAPFPGGGFVAGWLEQVYATVRGFSTTTPIYFRFDAQPDVAASYAGSLLDPVLVLSLSTGEAVPIHTRWIADAHGSGGDAYESVARVDPANAVGAIRARLAELGAAVVGGDQPLFGRRFEFQQRGYEDTLLVVNIPNLPAFRADVQQGAVDQHVRLRFAREVLPGLLAEGVVTPPRVVAFGHSIGAQMAAVGAGMDEPGAASPGALLINGTGGFVTHSVVASDLFQVRGGVGAQILALVGLEPDPDATPAEILGALFGVPESAWPNIDRHHPLALPFQLVVEGADPLAVAGAHGIGVTVFAGEGDSKVPADGFAWLAEATPFGALRPCTPSVPYDGHYCVFREPEGIAAFEDLVSVLR
jgi:hypothetical protein